MKTEIKSEYEVAAEKFLSDHGITFKAIFLFHGPHFPGEKEFRDIYTVMFIREGKVFSEQFGQSLANSRNYYQGAPKTRYAGTFRYFRVQAPDSSRFRPVKVKAPSAYDVLASLTKNHPGTFNNFCSDFGYDTDSRKAEKTYQNVLEEFDKVATFFKAEEFEQLQEIY